MRRVVVFELNEVPWRIIDWWTARRSGSALGDLVDRGTTWTTTSPDVGHLSPWITWPTVHRGVPNTEHGIGHFGQDQTRADEVAPTWWRRAIDGGRSVGLFGLLHTSTLPADVDRYAFFVPDTFAPASQTHPESLEPFQAFNLAMARASARNVSTAVDIPAALAFLRSAPSVGVRPSTVAAVARQLVDERRRPLTRVRRRSLQSVLAYDLFEHQLSRSVPDAAAFFTNHVASAMHRYWAATFPEDYPREGYGFGVDWVRTFRDEIDHALVQADRMVARLVRWCRDHEAVLVVVSSMGQQAAQGTPIGRQLVLARPEVLLAAAGLASTDHELRPAMVPQVNVQVAPPAVERLTAWLGTVEVAGSPVEWTHEDGLVSVTFGQADEAIGEVTVAGDVVDPAALGLEVIEIEDEVASTGYHVPEGVLIVLDPLHVDLDRRRPTTTTTQVAPMILDLLDLPVSASSAPPVPA